jgi:hypothetical protein
MSTLGFAADRYASGATWFIGADELLLASLGVVVIARGAELARAGAAAGLGLLAVVGAGRSGAALFHGVVFSVLPAPAARAVVAVAIAAGSVAAVGGTVHLFTLAERLPVRRASPGR